MEAAPRIDAAGILNFLEIPLGSAFDVEPSRALAYFRSRGLQVTFSYADMIRDAHDQAFTVAKMMDVDMLKQVQESLDAALAKGTSYRDWSKTVMQQLQSAGWWGKQDVIDPLTGNAVRAQLGSASRLETIFRTNMQAAYQAQKWEQIEEQKTIAPFLMYDAVDDFRTRPMHKLWDNTVLPADHPWWRDHFPPNGYNCRCGVIQLSQAELDALGIPISAKAPDNGTYTWTNPRTGRSEQVPMGIDPGFDRNVGVNLRRDTMRVLQEKIATLPRDLKAAAQSSIAKGQAATERDFNQVKRLTERAARAAADASANSALARIARSKADTFTRQALTQLSANERSVTGAAGLTAVRVLADQIRNQKNLLARYRTYTLEGKTPTDAQLAALGALTAAQRTAIDAEIAAEAARRLALATMAGILAATEPDPGSFLLAALKRLSDQDGFDSLDPVERLRRVRELAEELRRR